VVLDLSLEQGQYWIGDDYTDQHSINGAHFARKMEHKKADFEKRRCTIIFFRDEFVQKTPPHNKINYTADNQHDPKFKQIERAKSTT
jgi:hypothetical protein